jgi:hypothetical protein
VVKRQNRFGALVTLETRWQPSKFHAETGVCALGARGIGDCMRFWHLRLIALERPEIRGAMGPFDPGLLDSRSPGLGA